MCCGDLLLQKKENVEPWVKFFPAVSTDLLEPFPCNTEKVSRRIWRGEWRITFLFWSHCPNTTNELELKITSSYWFLASQQCRTQSPSLSKRSFCYRKVLCTLKGLWPFTSMTNISGKLVCQHTATSQSIPCRHQCSLWHFSTQQIGCIKFVSLVRRKGCPRKTTTCLFLCTLAAEFCLWTTSTHLHQVLP